MSYTVLVVNELWHHRGHNRHIQKGEVILDQDEVKKHLKERPHHVRARLATPDEAMIIEAEEAAKRPAPAADPVPTPAAPWDHPADHAE